jgi:hypothetical protein
MKIKSWAILAGLMGMVLTSLPAAQAATTLDDARDAKESISEFTLSMEGVNGIGIGSCDSKTGKRSRAGNHVYCVVISTASTKSFNALKALLPTGTRYMGVYISIENIGPIRPQPRASAGS